MRGCPFPCAAALSEEPPTEPQPTALVFVQGSAAVVARGSDCVRRSGGGYGLGVLDGEQVDGQEVDPAEVLHRYQAESDRDELVRLAKQLLRLGGERLRERRYDEALEILAEIPTRIAGATEPPLRRLAVRAYASIAECLERLGRHDEAGRARQTHFSYRDEVLAMYEEVADIAAQHLPERRRVLAAALFGKGVALGGLMRRDDALATMEHVVERFAEDSDPQLQAIVSTAREAISELNAPDVASA